MRGLSTRLAGSTALLLAANLFRTGAAYVIVVYISRSLGPQGLGQYTLVFGTQFLFQMVASVGLPAFLIREAGQYPENFTSLLKNSLTMAFAAGTVLGLVQCGLAALIQYDMPVRYGMYILGVTLGLSTCSWVVQQSFVALQRPGVILTVVILEQSLRAILSVAVLFAGYGVVALAIVFFLTSGLSFTIYWIIHWRRDASMLRHLRLLPSMDFVQRVVPFGLLSILQVTYWRIGPLLLGTIVGEVSLGIYSAADRLVQLVRTLPDVYILAAFPVHSRAYRESRRSLASSLVSSIVVNVAFLLPVVGLTSALAPYLMQLVFGPGFEASVVLLRIIVWWLAVYVLDQVLFRALIVTGHERTATWISASMLLAVLLLSVILIGSYEGLGLAIALLISQAIGFFLHVVWVARTLPELWSEMLRVWPVLTGISAAVIAGSLLVWVLAPVGIVLAGAVGVGSSLVIIVGAELGIRRFGLKGNLVSSQS